MRALPKDGFGVGVRRWPIEESLPTPQFPALSCQVAAPCSQTSDVVLMEAHISPFSCVAPVMQEVVLANTVQQLQKMEVLSVRKPGLGRYLLPNPVAGQAWPASAETSNLVRMRSQSLGQSAPSLTASLFSFFHLFSKRADFVGLLCAVEQTSTRTAPAFLASGLIPGIPLEL
ncbi:hypothetical protein ACRRTK_020177 [Alexandromys fortis]